MPCGGNAVFHLGFPWTLWPPDWLESSHLLEGIYWTRTDIPLPERLRPIPSKQKNCKFGHCRGLEIQIKFVLIEYNITCTHKKIPDALWMRVNMDVFFNPAKFCFILILTYKGQISLLHFQPQNSYLHSINILELVICIAMFLIAVNISFLKMHFCILKGYIIAYVIISTKKHECYTCIKNTTSKYYK